MSAILPFELGQPADWCESTERIILGAAMLGEPLPPWLEPKHFYADIHRYVFTLTQQVGCALHLVAARMRQDGRLYTREMGPDRHSKPGVLSSVDLAEMAAEAQHWLGMGWQLDCEGLVEMWRRRELLAVLTRVAVKLRGGAVSHAEAVAELKVHVLDPQEKTC